jgi:hypothetical protein
MASAEKAFLELPAGHGMYRWVMVDASQMAANLMMDTAECASEFAFLDPESEDPMSQASPLRAGTPVMKLQGQPGGVHAALHVHNAGEIGIELRTECAL